VSKGNMFAPVEMARRVPDTFSTPKRNKKKKRINKTARQSQVITATGSKGNLNAINITIDNRSSRLNKTKPRPKGSTTRPFENRNFSRNFAPQQYQMNPLRVGATESAGAKTKRQGRELVEEELLRRFLTPSEKKIDERIDEVAERKARFSEMSTILESSNSPIVTTRARREKEHALSSRDKEDRREGTLDYGLRSPSGDMSDVSSTHSSHGSSQASEALFPPGSMNLSPEASRNLVQPETSVSDTSAFGTARGPRQSTPPVRSRSTIYGPQTDPERDDFTPNSQLQELGIARWQQSRYDSNSATM
jgi:hypothetical protein